MRKFFISMGFVMLAAIVGSSSASAQSITTLGTASSTTVSFTTGVGTTGMAVLATTGNAGFSSGPLLTAATSWSIAPGSLTFTPNFNFGAAGTYTVSGTLNFTLKDASSATILTGTLTFPDAELSIKSSGDLLTLNANLAITGGSICTANPAVCGSGAENSVQLTVLLSGNHAMGRFGSGNATIGNAANLVTPEPTSMLLFGTGLLAFGGILRRKLLA
jgi:PEP-CTERM motif